MSDAPDWLNEVRKLQKENPDDPYVYVKWYFRKHGPELHCCVCGKVGVIYHPEAPNDNWSIEHGGWCSLECFEAEARAG